MNQNQLTSESCIRLASVYQLLSLLWGKEVTLDLLQQLNEPDLRDAIVNLGGSVPSEVSEPIVEELAIDYCQLLIGPKNHLPPVESVWVDGQFQAETAGSVTRYYELLPGFRANANSSMPDHIGTELQFMGELFQYAAVQENSEAYTSIADQFYEKHLGWTANFLQQVHAQAQTDFYRALAHVTQLFLNKDNRNEFA